MSTSRRTTIFIDGSAFRDTLRKAYFDRFHRLEETIDYHAFGQFLCAADEQLVRVNYCTGERAVVDSTRAHNEAWTATLPCWAWPLRVSLDTN